MSEYIVPNPRSPSSLAVLAHEYEHETKITITKAKRSYMFPFFEVREIDRLQNQNLVEILQESITS
jgi:hypothetical protein